jgi:hypothetical protein
MKQAEAEKMLEEYLEKDSLAQADLDKLLMPITDKKKQSDTFRSKLMIYNKPMVYVIVGGFI